MKTLTQVVLPIVVFLGLVFGVTYMTVYSPASRIETTAPSRTAGQAINFRRMEVKMLTLSPKEAKELAANGVDPDKVLPPPFWLPDYEVGQSGHADFWFENPHSVPVSLAIPQTNCQCGSADAVLVPKESMDQLKEKMASAAPDLISQAMIFGKATSEMGAPNWKLISLNQNGKVEEELRVPANSLGFVRVTWTAKGNPETRNLEAGWASRINPEDVADTGSLNVLFRIVPAVRIIVPKRGDNRIDLGRLGANAIGNGEFICWSATQPYLDISIEMHQTDKTALNEKAACISWAKDKDLTKAEMEYLQKVLSVKEKMPIFVRSAARYTVTVHERIETEKDGKKTVTELDLGPLAFRLGCFSGGKEADWVAVAAGVQGDVSIRSGDSDLDRVDLGEFEGNRGREKELSVKAQRPGMDLEFDSVMPDFLKVELKPEPDEGSLKRWKLIVRVPPGVTNGALPDDAQIILKTKDAAPRKIKIPVKGKAFFNGSPF